MEGESPEFTIRYVHRNRFLAKDLGQHRDHALSICIRYLGLGDGRRHRVAVDAD